MALTTAQIALMLFKKFMGKGSSDPSVDFFSESKNKRKAVYSVDIWNQADLIPSTAPGSSSGVVTKFVDEPLTAILGTTNAFYSANLIDCIPFNFDEAGGSYNYAFKDNLGNPISFGQGDWLVDTDNGTATFYGTLPANMPPTISFWKYSGTKGAGSAITLPAGSGGSDIRWTLPDSGAAREEFISTRLPAFTFDRTSLEQKILGIIQIPPDYVSGTFMYLRGLGYAMSADGTNRPVYTISIYGVGSAGATILTTANTTTGLRSNGMLLFPDIYIGSTGAGGYGDFLLLEISRDSTLETSSSETGYLLRQGAKIAYV